MGNEYLINSYKGDKEVRNEMHIAQCLAGMAFSNALLGIVHSMAHKTGAELTDSLVALIQDMNRKLNIPPTLKEYGVTEEDFNANLDFISKNAILDACTGSKPRPITVEEMKKVFECTYSGKKVDF